MKAITPFPVRIIYRLQCLICLLCLSLFSQPVICATQQVTSPTAGGYTALKLFLEDEELLTAIRRAKMLITFTGISDRSAKLVDKIADSSELALEELETLAGAKPAIVFEDLSNETIALATLDSLRSKTAREFLFDGRHFEKNLLLSQLKILRVISHLAKQIENKESNAKRRAWLNRLAEQYENYYQQVLSRISVAHSNTRHQQKNQIAAIYSH